MNIETLMKEVREYQDELNVDKEGEHLWDNYQRVTAILIRVAAIRNDIAFKEVMGTSSAQEKKFRTMILDPFIDRLKDVANFESRKITAKGMELNLER